MSCCEEQSKLVATAAKDHRVKVSEVQETAVVLTAETKLEGVERLTWNPLGSVLACGTVSGSCKLLQITESSSEPTGKLKRMKTSRGLEVTTLAVPHKDSISALVWPTLDLLYTGSLDHSVIEWDLERSAVSNSILMPRVRAT
jgi:WD40 repeat protein